MAPGRSGALPGTERPAMRRDELVVAKDWTTREVARSRSGNFAHEDLFAMEALSGRARVADRLALALSAQEHRQDPNG